MPSFLQLLHVSLSRVLRRTPRLVQVSVVCTRFFLSKGTFAARFLLGLLQLALSFARLGHGWRE